MSHRALWVMAFTIEAILMVIGIVFIDDSGSLVAGYAWSLTQMPSLAISNWVIPEHFNSNAPFIILTFALQGTLFSSAFSLFKWGDAKLAAMPSSARKKPVQPSGTESDER